MLSSLAFVHIIETTNLIIPGINQSQTRPFSTTFEYTRSYACIHIHTWLVMPLPRKSLYSHYNLRHQLYNTS